MKLKDIRFFPSKIPITLLFKKINERCLESMKNIEIQERLMTSDSGSHNFKLQNFINKPSTSYKVKRSYFTINSSKRKAPIKFNKKSRLMKQNGLNNNINAFITGAGGSELEKNSNVNIYNINNFNKKKNRGDFVFKLKNVKNFYNDLYNIENYEEILQKNEKNIDYITNKNENGHLIRKLLSELKNKNYQKLSKPIYKTYYSNKESMNMISSIGRTTINFKFNAQNKTTNKFVKTEENFSISPKNTNNINNLDKNFSSRDYCFSNNTNEKTNELQKKIQKLIKENEKIQNRIKKYRETRAGVKSNGGNNSREKKYHTIDEYIFSKAEIKKNKNIKSRTCCKTSNYNKNIFIPENGNKILYLCPAKKIKNLLDEKLGYRFNYNIINDYLFIKKKKKLNDFLNSLLESPKQNKIFKVGNKKFMSHNHYKLIERLNDAKNRRRLLKEYYMEDDSDELSM